MKSVQARYYSHTDDDTVLCVLCPRRCTIREDSSGHCKVRVNRKGTLELPYYGRISSIAVDPIEKKPLYHFYPGSSILSVGFIGCSFHCPFCQNYSISQGTSAATRYIQPEGLVRTAEERDSFAIAYTYSEPTIHIEYVIDTAVLARKRGLKNVLVSNGYLNSEPAEELISYMDAANIDLKTFNADFYRKELGGSLDAVLAFISRAAGRLCLEVTTLVIPGKNDSEQEIESIAKFLGNLNKSIPLHLSCYYPTYKYAIPPTNPRSVLALKKCAEKYLHFVYAGNVWDEETNTYCPSCGELLIQRKGYATRIAAIENSTCTRCGTAIDIQGT